MMAMGAPALWGALLCAVASVVLGALAHGAAGASARGRSGATRTAGVLTQAALASLTTAAVASLLAVTALWSALLNNDFSLRYVAQYTSVLLSRQPLITALWAGQAGTVLWFTAMLLGSGAVAALVHRRRPLTPLAIAAIGMVAITGLAALCFGPSPFTRLANVPNEGRGFPPLLLHQGMLLQPPLLLLALAVPVVPFAFTAARVIDAMGGRTPDRMIARDEHDLWRALLQRWLVIAWMCLTLALGLGLWWAQQQLGWWGYYFTWEPYASAPMLPWVAVSALLVVLRSEADRESGAWWLAAFVAFAFLLALFALVRARAGIAESIRAVAAGPSTFLVVLGAMGVALTGAVAVLALREGPRVRIGGMLTSIGVLLLASGLGASHWRRDVTTGIDIGQVVDVRDPFGQPWRFTSQGLSSYQEPAYTVVAVAVNATRGRVRAGLLTSQQRQYYDAADNEIYEPVTRVGSLIRWNQTVTLGFLGAIDRTNAAVRVSFIPLVWAVWGGLVLCVLGMLLAAWPTLLERSDVLPHALCPVCGAPLVASDAHFCAQCGAVLVAPTDGATPAP